MQERLFRQKSIERISSPEQLQDYMRVTSPAIWMVLAAVAVLLIGLIAASALATLESTLPLRGEVLDSGEIISIALTVQQKDIVEVGMPVRIAGRNAHISFIYQDEADVIAMAEFDAPVEPLPEDTYDVEIVTETLTPISFLLN